MHTIFSKINNMISTEKDTFWNMTHYTLELTQLEDSCRARWDDEASKYLWTRYVYPFEADSKDMLSYYDEVIAKSDLIVEHDNTVCENSFEITKLTEEISGLMTKARQEIDTSQQSLDRTKEYYGKYRDTRDVIDSHFDRENTYNSEFSSVYSTRMSVY